MGCERGMVKHCATIRLALAALILLVAAPVWAQTPTLVQHYYPGANSPPRGLTAEYYTFRLPNPTRAGNALIMFLDHPSDVTVASITDDRLNAWPAAAVAADNGPGNPVSAAYVLPNVAAGTRVITVTFSDAVAGVHAVFLEYYNVATSNAVGGTASSTATASPVISSGSLAAASGNLLLHYAMDNVGQVGGEAATEVTGWSAGAGWTMLAGDINNSHDISSFAVQARIANGTAINPTLTAIQSAPDTFNSIALELKAASAGTPPAPGIRILKQQFFSHTALAVPGSWTQFFPAQGNLLAAINIYRDSTQSAVTDTNGNAWSAAHTLLGVPAIQYAENATTSSTLKVTIPLTDANSNTTITLYDIVGAASSSVLAQVVTGDDTDASGASVVTDAPTITPLVANGLIIVAVGFGQGPATGLAPGAPPTALFMPVTYPGETDFDTFNNADGYAHSYYGTDLSPQNYTWFINPQVSNSYNSAAVEFRAASFSLAVVRAGVGSGTVSSVPSGINCGTNCAANFAGGTSVQLIPTPAPGSGFVGWSGGCSGSSGCTVNVSGPTVVTATFTIVATLLTPSGTIATASPTYTWTAVPGATQYLLWVDDASGGRIRTVYTAAQAGCAGGTGTCSITPTVVLTPGAGQWFIVAANASGNGPWSAAMAFTVTGTPPPAAAALVAPSGSIANATPTFTWNAVAGATQYLLWVDDASGGRIRTWYTAAQAGCPSGTGTCSLTPTVVLAPGAGQWYIVTANASGNGPWSAAMAFTVAGTPPPAAATLVTPSGSIANATPTFTWNAVAGATQYLLWVDDSSGGRIRASYTVAQAGCPSGTGTCSLTPTVVLTPGTGQWYIVTANASGNGPWSAAMAYTVAGTPPPGAATLVAPSGSIATATPTFTWNAVTGATQYLLWVDDASGGRIRTVYTATQAGCASGTGTCSLTPTVVLTPGTGRWFIVAANASGNGPWSSAMAFTLSGTPPPGAATLVAPSGSIATATPTFTWNAVTGATQYLLWVDDASGGRIRTVYTAAQAGCAGGTGTCSLTPSVVLTPGAGQWFIVAANASGNAPWSAAAAFVAP